jgi:hypothetical protein
MAGEGPWDAEWRRLVELAGETADEYGIDANELVLEMKRQLVQKLAATILKDV